MANQGMAEPSDNLHFSIGRYPGGFNEVAIHESTQVSCRYARGPIPMDPLFASPTDSQWRAFWETLDSIGVWQWHEYYKPAEPIMDGTQWSLELAHAGRKLSCAGSNAYPCETPSTGGEPFTRFIIALIKLTGFTKLRTKCDMNSWPVPPRITGKDISRDASAQRLANAHPNRQRPQP